MITKVNALPALRQSRCSLSGCFSGRLQSALTPSPSVASGMLSILDKVFKGELSCHCEERSLRRGNLPLQEEIALHSLRSARNDMWTKVDALPALRQSRCSLSGCFSGRLQSALTPSPSVASGMLSILDKAFIEAFDY